MRAFPIQESGERVKHGARLVELKLRSARERQTAAAAARAGVRRAWRLGTLDLRFAPSPPGGSRPPEEMKRHELVAFALLSSIVPLSGPTILAIAAAMVWRASAILPPAQIQWVQMMCIAAAALWIGTAAYLVRAGFMLSRWRATARIIRMTGHGVTTLDRSGRGEEKLWSELRRVDPLAWPARLGFADGTEFAVPRGARAWQVAELACDEHLGNASALRDIIRRRARGFAVQVLVLCLLTLPPALSGPFGGGSQRPLPLVWPIVLSLVCAAATMTGPDLGNLCVRSLWRVERLLAPSFRGRRLSRVRWAPGVAPSGL